MRETTLDTGHSAAIGLERWEDALTLNREILESQIRRGAEPLELVRSRFNDYGPLLRLGRFDEAKHLRLQCRAALQAEHDLVGLAKVLSALASLHSELGQPGDAVRFEQDSLRFEYLNGDAGGAATSHYNLGLYLTTMGQYPSNIAHVLAAAVIRFQTGFDITSTLELLAYQTSQVEDDPPFLRSFAELSREVEKTDGVTFSTLFDRLPKRLSTGDTVLGEILRLVGEVRSAQAVSGWEALILGVVAAAKGEPGAAQEVEAVLGRLGQDATLADLAAALGRIAAGERGDTLLENLDEFDTGIVKETLALLGPAEE